MKARLLSADFSNISQEFSEHLREEKFFDLVQTCLDGHLLNNSPWKTYWLANHPCFGEVFIKINYGYPDAEDNEILGKKEALLPQHFSRYYVDTPQIRLPRVHRHWKFKAAYIVVYERVKFTKHSLFSVLLDKKHAGSLLQFTDIWRNIPPPDWWNSGHVLHDFGAHDSLRGTPKTVSPFGFDLDDNIGLDDQGRLYFYDFEFVQWTTAGLQQVYMAYKVLNTRKHLLRELGSQGKAKEFLNQVKSEFSRELEEQAAGAYINSLRRNNAKWPSYFLFHLAGIYINTRQKKLR